MIECVECGPDISVARSDAWREGFNSDVDSDDKRNTVVRESCSNSLLESLILAQDERWRRA